MPAQQGNLVLGSDGRLQYLPMSGSVQPSAPMAPMAPMGSAPSPSIPSMVPIQQMPQYAAQPVQLTYQSGFGTNPELDQAQKSLNCWAKWVKVFSALLLSVNIVVHLA